MNKDIYHRRLIGDDNEESKVRASGELWGYAPRLAAGNAGPRVKAFCGPLPSDRKGYSFTTDTPPSNSCKYFGEDGVEWREETDGVVSFTDGNSDVVKIMVSVI